MMAVVMASTCVAQAFGRFTWGVVLPGARDDLLDGSNTLAGFFGTVNVTAYLLGTLFVAWASGRFSLVALVRLGLTTSTVSLGIASVACAAVAVVCGVSVCGEGGRAVCVGARACSVWCGVSAIEF